MSVSTAPPASHAAKDPKDGNDLVEVENLKVYFPIRAGIFKTVQGNVKAVDDISFTVRRGETLGLVGESGCGKSTTGRALIRLREPTEGTVKFDGVELTSLKPEQLRRLRRRMQIIFQDPYGSLDPRMTVGSIISEPLDTHKLAKGDEKRARVAELLKMVGLDPSYVNRYPHEFSGGQRQRIAIARAVVLRPEVLVLDEPTSALDVSVQAQVLGLLAELQRRYGMSYVFISHDLAVVRAMAHRVLVMKDGAIVEEGEAEALFAAPREAYTRALVAAAHLA